MAKRIDVVECATDMAFAFNQHMQPKKLANQDELAELLAMVNSLILRQLPSMSQAEKFALIRKALAATKKTVKELQ